MLFLTKGRCAVYSGKNKIKALVEGSYFGEIGCILGGIRRAGIKAVTNCELQSLTKRNLHNLLGEYPDVGEELRAIARQRMAQVRTSHNKIEVGNVKRLLDVRTRRQSEGLNIPKNLKLSEHSHPTIKEGDEEAEEEEKEEKGEKGEKEGEESEGASSSSGTKASSSKKQHGSGGGAGGGGGTSPPKTLARAASTRARQQQQQQHNSPGGGAGVRGEQHLSSSPKRGVAREFSVTSALISDGHQKLSSSDIAEINEKAVSPLSAGDSPESRGSAAATSAEAGAPSAVGGGRGQSTHEFILTEVDRLVAAKMELITEMLMKSVEGNMLDMFNQIQAQVVEQKGRAAAAAAAAAGSGESGGGGGGRSA